MKKNDDWTSASELAKMGYCERHMFFEAKLGERSSKERQADRQRGTRLHAAFYEEGQMQPAAKPWCFVASAVYGSDSPETNLLRRFRDRWLRPYRAGRWLVAAYYRHSPGWCRLVQDRPRVRALVRIILRPLLGTAAAFERVGKDRPWN